METWLTVYRPLDIWSCSGTPLGVGASAYLCPRLPEIEIWVQMCKEVERTLFFEIKIVYVCFSWAEYQKRMSMKVKFPSRCKFWWWGWDSLPTNCEKSLNRISGSTRMTHKGAHHIPRVLRMEIWWTVYRPHNMWSPKIENSTLKCRWKSWMFWWSTTMYIWGWIV